MRISDAKSRELLLNDGGRINDATTNPLTSSVTNAVTQITEAGIVGKSWYITYIDWMVSGTAPVGASNLALTLKDGTTTIYSSAIPSGSVNGTSHQILLPVPIKITEGSSFTLDIASPNNIGCDILTNLGAFNQ